MLFGTGTMNCICRMLPAQAATTTPAAKVLSQAWRVISFCAALGWGRPNDMFIKSAPCSKANCMAATQWVSSPTPSLLKVFKAMMVASGAMPVCEPEDPVPQMVPATCVPCPQSSEGSLSW